MSMLRNWNAHRTAVQSGDIGAIKETFDACEEWIDFALGRGIGGTVRRAYARSDMLDARAMLMQRWADYVTGEAAQVVPLRSGK